MKEEFQEINRSVYVALASLAAISTSMVSMFATDDPYGRHPWLRFRFAGTAKDAPIYQWIRAALADFKGHLQWELLTREDAVNFLIAPKLLDDHDLRTKLPSPEQLIGKLGREAYEGKIRLAMEDVPGLAACIRRCAERD